MEINEAIKLLNECRTNYSSNRRVKRITIKGEKPTPLIVRWIA